MTTAAAPPPASDSAPPLTLRGEARFWRISFALFLSGLATFALLYCVQPMLPEFVRAFSLTPAAASLSLSVTTAVLAIAMFGAGALSDAYGRKTRDGDLAHSRRRGDARLGHRAELAGR